MHLKQELPAPSPFWPQGVTTYIGTYGLGVHNTDNPTNIGLFSRCRPRMKPGRLRMPRITTSGEMYKTSDKTATTWREFLKDGDVSAET